MEGRMLPTTHNNVIRAAMAKASSKITASMTKNLSNKNKERVSIAGTIVKLIKQQNHPASSADEAVAVTLVHQMEHINRSRRQRRRQREQRWKGLMTMEERVPGRDDPVVAVVVAAAVMLAVTAMIATAVVMRVVMQLAPWWGDNNY